jgi:hypothetical protein
MCDSDLNGARGKDMRKTSSLKSSRAPTRSTHTLVRDKTSRRSYPPSIGSPLSLGRDRGTPQRQMVAVCRCPRRVCHVPVGCQCFRHRVIREIPPIPSPCGSRCHGGRVTLALYGRCAVAVTLVHRPRHSNRWWVSTRGEVGWES